VKLHVNYVGVKCSYVDSILAGWILGKPWVLNFSEGALILVGNIVVTAGPNLT